MTRPVLRTERLELRPMTLEHLPHLVELDSDPEVLRHVLGRARTAEEVHEFWGPRCADTAADAQGLGFWAGHVDGEFVGWWDLEPSGEGRAEAGWRLRRDRWRQGLASEGAVALLDHAFGAAGLHTVWAETLTTNLGSRGVMARLGMRHVRTAHPDWTRSLPDAAEGAVVHEITVEEWRARRG
ncbi:GNAT family N-acetyltransferase [Nocardioides sp. SYSU D00038]|uniref:GNAT family N-acetyltransferase n=1 Tax=Nocardioides sp. SYSU D00038 TaxID=2812554 RepID=UPI001967B2D0|nr:GNAT family N-acetyltransferase [Nocardioides sp. SYSU D00038]